MKKKIIITLFILFICVGCKTKEVTIENKRQDVIQNTVGKTTENRVVIKDEKGSEYYVYEIEEKSFTLYDYLFYKNEKEYTEAKEKYAANTYYQYAANDEIRMIKITLQTGVGESLNQIRENIISQYKNDKSSQRIC